MTSTSMRLIANAIRCAARPASVAPTVRTTNTVRTPYIHPVATAYTTEPWTALAESSGPNTRGLNRTDNHSATTTGTAAAKMAADEPLSPAPNNQRGKNMNVAPRKYAAEPLAVAT